MIQPSISRHARTRDVLHSIETGRRPGAPAAQLLDAWDEDIRIGAFDTDQLALDLDLHLRSFAAQRYGQRPSRLVWQCSLRADPRGPGVPGAQLAQLGRDILHATGVARSHEADGCRWALIRVSPHEARIVAPLMTPGGEVRDTTASRPLALAVCQLSDRRHGTAPTGTGSAPTPVVPGRRR